MRGIGAVGLTAWTAPLAVAEVFLDPAYFTRVSPSFDLDHPLEPRTNLLHFILEGYCYNSCSALVLIKQLPSLIQAIGNEDMKKKIYEEITSLLNSNNARRLRHAAMMSLPGIAFYLSADTFTKIFGSSLGPSMLFPPCDPSEFSSQFWTRGSKDFIDVLASLGDEYGAKWVVDTIKKVVSGYGSSDLVTYLSEQEDYKIKLLAMDCAIKLGPFIKDEEPAILNEFMGKAVEWLDGAIESPNSPNLILGTVEGCVYLAQLKLLSNTLNEIVAALKLLCGDTRADADPDVKQYARNAIDFIKKSSQH